LNFIHKIFLLYKSPIYTKKAHLGKGGHKVLVKMSLSSSVTRLSAKDMETIIVEMYKMMPEKFIEEKQIDELITHGKVFTEGKKVAKRLRNQQILSV
jgi:hypothetical protein